MSGTFKIGDWVWDGDDYGSILSIDEDEQTVNLFDGNEGWTADIESIMPDRRPIGYCDRPQA